MNAQEAAEYRHIIATSPITVDLGGGRQGLTNPAWCGWYGQGITGAHPYSGYRHVVTCPDCIHLDDCERSGCNHPTHA
jgi:hypothetical protein